jgi:hypothetical protein
MLDRIIKFLGERINLVMNDQSQINVQQGDQESRVNKNQKDRASTNRQYAGQVFASLYRCKSCDCWWGNSQQDVPEKRLLWHLVEPHSNAFLWVDYRGWQQKGKAGLCPECGQAVSEADFMLSFDKHGEVVWPEGVDFTDGESGDDARESNLFLEYISQSKKMEQNMAVIAAWEERRRSNAPGYTADIDDLRGEMDKMRTAFKDVVYSYAPLLPPGWRVTGDYDQWVKKQACAGFMHGEIQPDITLMIGGRCTTVAELEMELDRLFQYVCASTC